MRRLAALRLAALRLAALRLPTLRLPTLAVAAILLVATSACDLSAPSRGDPSRDLDRPPVHVLSVEVATTYDFAGRPLRTPLSEGRITEGVAISTSLRVTFDRFLLPHRIIRQSLCLRPSTEPVTGLQDCIEPSQIFTEPEYRPAGRQVIYRLPAGARLYADTLYRLTVYRTLDGDSPGFFAFDGAPLARTYTFDFRTHPLGGIAMDEPLPSPERYCAATRCFDDCGGDESCEQSCQPLCIEPTCYRKGAVHRQMGRFLFGPCASAGCHGSGVSFGNNSDMLTSASLDLSSSLGVAQTAIGQTAHGSQQGEASVQDDQSPERFGRAMPLIDPHNPGNSYLLYKLIIHQLNHRRPAEVIDPGLATALARLHGGALVGLAMPAETGHGPTGLVEPSEDPEGTLSRSHMDVIQAWIAHGAVLSCDQ